MSNLVNILISTALSAGSLGIGYGLYLSNHWAAIVIKFAALGLSGCLQYATFYTLLPFAVSIIFAVITSLIFFMRNNLLFGILGILPHICFYIALLLNVEFKIWISVTVFLLACFLFYLYYVFFVLLFLTFIFTPGNHASLFVMRNIIFIMHLIISPSLVGGACLYMAKTPIDYLAHIPWFKST